MLVQKPAPVLLGAARRAVKMLLAGSDGSSCPAPPCLPCQAAGRPSCPFLPELLPCSPGAERAAFPPGSARKLLGLGSQAGLFPQQSLGLGKAVTLFLSFLRLLFFHASIPPPPHTPRPLKSNSPSVCEASASCLTSLIYKANRMFLLTHIMLSLLMKKTIPGGQPRGPLKPASKNSSNAQRVRSSKTIFHTMK